MEISSDSGQMSNTTLPCCIVTFAVSGWELRYDGGNVEECDDRIDD